MTGIRVNPNLNRGPFTLVNTNRTVGTFSLRSRNLVTVVLKTVAFSSAVTPILEESLDGGTSWQALAAGMVALSGLSAETATRTYKARPSAPATHVRLRTASGTYSAGSLTFLLTLQDQGVEASPSAPVTGRQATTTSAVALAAAPCRSVRIKNNHASEVAYIGTAGVATTTGYPLIAAESVEIAIDDVSKVFVIAGAAGTVAWVVTA